MDHEGKGHSHEQHSGHQGHHEHHHDMTHKAKARHEHHHMGHGGHQEHHKHMVEDFRKRFWISMILTVPILALSPMIQKFIGLEGIAFKGSNYILLLFSTVLFFYGGKPFLIGLVDEFRRHVPGMMTLIAVAITVAFAYSVVVVFGLQGKLLFWELATLIDIMLLGHWIEMKSVMGASRALEELVKLMPSEAHRLMDDGSVEDIPVMKLEVGNRFLVRPGEKFPADGKVVDGHTSVNESLLTGESKPVHKIKGDNVIGGSLNGEGTVTVLVEKIGEDTFLSQVVRLVSQAQASKSRTQDFANRAAFWLTVISISVGVLTLVMWLIYGPNLSYAIERMVTVMVITCPHALGLAIPLVVAVSTSIAARNGLLLRNRAAFEQARNVDAIVFDKTGTLTEGHFGVQDVIMFSDVDANAILKLAASLENKSEHPIAGGILREAKERNLKIIDADEFEVLRGTGVRGQVDGNDVMVVSPGYLEENLISYSRHLLDEHYAKGYTVVFVIVNNKVLGAISLGDTVRAEAKEAIDALHLLGIKCIMMTGDNGAVAKAVSEELGLDEYFAEVLPGEKAEKIRELQARGLRVAMTGDGVNDAPALATADVGIAIGAGTDVAVETADIVLVRSNPKDVVAIISLAKATYRKMVQNLFWATGYNLIAIPLAAGVLVKQGIVLSPAAGAVLMSLSTVIVAVNARFLTTE